MPGLFEGSKIGAEAYFAYINSQGGVNGRKLVLDAHDSAFSSGTITNATQSIAKNDFAIVGEADDWHADVIVMGLPYKRRFGEFNLGKTVPYVLKNANCRVMLFREHREHAV